MESSPGRLRDCTVLRHCLAPGLMLCISVLSLTPGVPNVGHSPFVWLVDMTPKPAQKILHVCFYAVLTVALSWNLRRIDSPTARFLLASFFALGFGVLMEWLQTFVPGRFGSLTDVVLDGIGCLLAFGFMRRRATMLA